LTVVSRRIEIELTSARPDGSWTWRAAGAREPRGVLDGTLLHAGAKAGDVVRAEADFELEGITIISVLAPKTDSRPEAVRIEVVGPGRPETPGVTTQLVGRADRRSGDRHRDRDESRPRRDRDQGRPQTGRDSGRPRRDSVTESGEQAARTGGHRGPGERRDRNRGDRPTGPGPGAADHAPAREGGPGRGRRERVSATASAAEVEADRTKPRRLNPGNTHRRAVMEALPPEERPIAEQVLRGGIPAVRTALHLEREKATAEGRPAPNTDELVAMAERLLPRLKAAEWRDRAEAAAASADEISLRDLRSVAAGADVARDEETRALAAKVRDALDRRVTAMYQEWSGDIAKQLDDGRVVRALRLSARPPDPAARLDPELGQRLTDAAGAAMSPDTPADRWVALLDAVAVSPVRRSVQPVGLPADAPPDLKRSAHQHSGSIPALAKLLGVSMPPPPVPAPTRRRPDSGATGPRRSKPPRRRGSQPDAGHDHGSAHESRARQPERIAETDEGPASVSSLEDSATTPETSTAENTAPETEAVATGGPETRALPDDGIEPAQPAVVTDQSDGVETEAVTPEVQQSMAPATPEAPVGEAVTPEAVTPEAASPEAGTPEAATPEAPTVEVPAGGTVAPSAEAAPRAEPTHPPEQEPSPPR
jgi:hypothetical protein